MEAAFVEGRAALPLIGGASVSPEIRPCHHRPGVGIDDCRTPEIHCTLHESASVLCLGAEVQRDDLAGAAWPSRKKSTGETTFLVYCGTRPRATKTSWKTDGSFAGVGGAFEKQLAATEWSVVLFSGKIGSEFQVKDTVGKVVTNDKLPSFSTLV